MFSPSVVCYLLLSHQGVSSLFFKCLPFAYFFPPPPPPHTHTHTPVFILSRVHCTLSISAGSRPLCKHRACVAISSPGVSHLRLAPTLTHRYTHTQVHTHTHIHTGTHTHRYTHTHTHSHSCLLWHRYRHTHTASVERSRKHFQLDIPVMKSVGAGVSI